MDAPDDISIRAQQPIPRYAPVTTEGRIGIEPFLGIALAATPAGDDVPVRRGGTIFLPRSVVVALYADPWAGE